MFESNHWLWAVDYMLLIYSIILPVYFDTKIKYVSTNPIIEH